MMRLIFVESADTFSTYRDPDGEIVYLAHGVGFRRLTPFDDLDLRESWRDYAFDHGPDADGWLDLLRETTTEPDLVDGIVWCMDCHQPMHEEDLDCTDVGDGDVLCDNCLSAWGWCERCETHVRETITTLDDENVCDSCRREHFSWCDDCEGWFRDSEADNHDHDQDEEQNQGCCESPARTFTVRNDGQEPLANDTRVTVTLPDGTISSEGMAEISRYLWQFGHSLYDVAAQTPGRDTEAGRQERQQYLALAQEPGLSNEVGCTWQTRAGNFTKRLSRYAYKAFGLKLSPEVMSQVGCIARAHSTAVDFHLEVTRELNLSAAEMGNSGSCWWNSYSESRCALKTNGGFAIRTFHSLDGGSGAEDVNGRAWVMPLKQTDNGLRPTFDTHAEVFVVFNGYGALTGYAPARILAHMAGMTYRKINFDCSPMYVNGGSGYLVAPEEIAAPFTDGRLTLAVNRHANLFDTETKGKDLAHVA